MANNGSTNVSNKVSLSHNEKVHAIFIFLATLDILFVPNEFWHNFIALVCFLGAALAILGLLQQNQEFRGRYLVLFLLYALCCFKAIISMFFDPKIAETILNLLATLR